jgi:hypothetical protein
MLLQGGNEQIRLSHCGIWSISMTYYIGFHGESSNEATGTVRKLHGFQIYFPEAIKHDKHEERMRKNRQRSNNNIKIAVACISVRREVDFMRPGIVAEQLLDAFKCYLKNEPQKTGPFACGAIN